MKEQLCLFFTNIIHERKLSFSEVAKLSGMSKTQVNHIVNHKGKEVSLEKILNGIHTLGYNVNISLEG